MSLRKIITILKGYLYEEYIVFESLLSNLITVNEMTQQQQNEQEVV